MVEEAAVAVAAEDLEVAVVVEEAVDAGASAAVGVVAAAAAVASDNRTLGLLKASRRSDTTVGRCKTTLYAKSTSRTCHTSTPQSSSKTRNKLGKLTRFSATCATISCPSSSGRT